jgi:2'-5' RNA ligase
VRLFVAIRLPEAVVSGLKHVRGRLGEFDGILRYPGVTGFHLTLAFLGELPEGGDEMVESGLRSACAGFGSFALALGAGGSFPEGGEARVIWLGVEGELRRASDLQKIVVKELGDLGLRMDKRPFSPHVTIARVTRKAGEEDRRRVAEVAAEIDGYDTGTFRVTDISVMASDLQPTGAVYTPIAEIPL